ncbi:uncharacterized protein TNCV_2876091 [Trichonephila clavipes]|nr:uncharacterized protein TNCV_2876091 [Trichonephila clavipes]
MASPQEQAQVVASFIEFISVTHLQRKWGNTTLEFGKEFNTVIEDDYDTNVDSEKELSLEQTLELAITRKISTNQNTIQKLAISKIIRREIDLFEDERFRGKYLEKVYHELLTIPSTSVDVERAFPTAGNFYI